MGVLLISCRAGDILAANVSTDNKDGLIVQYRDNDAAADMLKTMEFQVYRKQKLAANVDLLKLTPGTNRQEIMARLKKQAGSNMWKKTSAFVCTVLPMTLIIHNNGLYR
ncbi:hypothetical protein [Syntrophomonas wolfei]|uniref:hypothetical protein n=1 Tax=Syntrophomonas wolfei TaxID=863 RepID=UPI0023EF803F|nr:hypothetical protein [Syntrophomonas wolfei]